MDVRDAGSLGGKRTMSRLTAAQKSELGRKAALAQLASMTPEQRSERARKAGLAPKKKTPKP